jgi:hypothetical protein
MIHRRRHLESTGVSTSTWISNEVSITNVSNLTQLENQTIDNVEYLVYSFTTQNLKTMVIATSIDVNKMLITSSYGGTMAFGNDLTYDDSTYSFSAGETVTVCRDDATSFNSVKLTDNAQLSSTVTLYIPAAAIRYIRLEITTPESLEYSDTIISGTYKAYYTYNTSRDVYAEEGVFIENFPATGDGSAEVTEIFTFTKYGLTTTAEVVRKQGSQLVTQFCPENQRRGVTFSSPVYVELISNVPGKYFSIKVTKEMNLETGMFPVITYGGYVATDDLSNGLGWSVAAVPTSDNYYFTCLTSSPSPEVFEYTPIYDGTATYSTAVASYMDGFKDSSLNGGCSILFARI